MEQEEGGARRQISAIAELSGPVEPARVRAMIPRFLVFPALLLTALAPLRAAEPHGEALIDPANAGPDYAVQGEYMGDNCAAQIIALGAGKYHIVGWAHGLPGAAPDAEKKHEVDAKTEGDKVTFDGEGFKGSIAGETLTGTNDQGQSWTLKKTVRHSPTEGPPVVSATRAASAASVKTYPLEVSSGRTINSAPAAAAVRIASRARLRLASRCPICGDSWTLATTVIGSLSTWRSSPAKLPDARIVVGNHFQLG